MSILKRAAMLVPPLERLRSARDQLLAENAVLRQELLLARDRPLPAAASLTPEQAHLLAEASHMLRARDEHRLFMTDYAYHPQERPLAQSASGRQLAARFGAAREQIAATLTGIARHSETLARIPREATAPLAPLWDNPWFPPFDGATLYGLIAEHRPRRFVEIGSGISTRFARQAIQDLGLATRIVSIDPHPHNAVEGLCDETIVARMEDMPEDFWRGFSAEDMLFVDNSHRSFPASDVTCFFAEVMPALPPGMLFGLHDIFLPHDYPAAWNDRFYSEQYLLMTYLLGGGGGDAIILPVNWTTEQPDLVAIMAPLFSRPIFAGLNINGGCFWLRRGAAG